MPVKTSLRYFAIQLAALDGDYMDAVGVSAGAVAKWASVFWGTIL